MGRELWLNFLIRIVLKWTPLEIFMLEIIVRSEWLILQVSIWKDRSKFLVLILGQNIKNYYIIKYYYEKIGYVSTISGTNSNCSQEDGNLNIARFNGVTGLYFDSANNQLLISDNRNYRVKVLDFNCKISLLSFYFHSTISFPY